MGLRTGAEYLAELRDKRRILYQGRWVTDVTVEPVFRKTALAVAQFYDFQNQPDVRDVMSFVTADGDRAGMAFLEPRSKEDLRRRATAFAAWAEITCGFMGRSPDYMNAAVMAVGAAAPSWGIREARWGKNATSAYLEARRRDLTYTHTVVQPFTDRVKPATEQTSTLRVVRETSDGVIVSGAKGMATLAPFCNSNMCILTPPLASEDHKHFAIAFHHDIDTPGVHWICRDAYGSEQSTFDAPLSSRGLDEMDCLAIFEDALIPWENIYLYKDIQLANNQPSIVKFEQGLGHHVLIRAIAKTRFLLGLGHLMAESAQVNQFFNVQERLGEFAIWLMNLESLAIAAIEGAEKDSETGIWYPNRNALRTSLRLFPEYNRKMISHLISMGGSGFVSTPQEESLQRFGELLEPYYRGAQSSAGEKVQLFRLAWDVVGSTWGSRNELYERFFFGEQQRSIVQTYLQFDKTEAVESVRRVLLGATTEHQPFPTPRRFGGEELEPYTGDVGGRSIVGRPMSALESNARRK